MKNYKRKIGDKFPSETLRIVFTKHKMMSENHHYKFERFEKHLKHHRRGVELITFKNGQIAILEFNDNDEIVVDTIKEGLTIPQVKEMLDNDISIVDICSLTWTYIINSHTELIRLLGEISEEEVA